MVRRPTKPEAPDEKDPMQVLLETLQKNSNTMNKLLVGLNQMTKANQAKSQEKSPEELAIYKERLALLQERRKQAEIDTKRREEESKKAQRDDYKNNIVYRAGTNIAGQKSSATSAMALSVLTGGLINPVIAKTFGMDKLLSASVNAVGRGIGRATNAAGRGLLNAGKSIKNHIFSNNDEEEDTKNKGKTKKRDSSAVAIDKDKNPKIEKALEGIKANTDKLVGKTPEEAKEEQKSGIMDKLMTGAKIASAIAGLAAGVYTGIKYFDQIKNTLTKIGEFLNPIIKGISAIAKATWDAITSIAEDATNAVLSVKEGWDSVMNFFSDLGTAVGSEWSQFKELGLIGYLKAKFSGKGSTEPKVYKTQTLAENQLKNMERAQTDGVDLNSIPLDKMTTAQRRVYLANQANDENGGGYGTFNKTSSSKDDIVIHNRQAKSLDSLGLSGSVASTNSIPYIAETNTEALKKLDSTINDWGYDVIYTSAMGGHKPGTGHWKGNKVDLQLKKGGKSAHLSYAQLQALRKAGYWGFGTGALGWEPVSGQVGGGHYDLFLGNGGGNIGGGEIQYAQNNVGSELGTATKSIGKMESQKLTTTEDDISSGMADMNETLQQNNTKQADNTSFGGLSTPPTSSASNYNMISDSSGSNMPQFAGLTGGSSGGQQSKAGTVYAYGDVAKTAILHTI